MDSQINTVAPARAATAVAFEFTGRAGEYFRIWIVNICLSVITLGIYSAWAKVRRKRYFYGNTLLQDAAFDYLGNPKAILKGRIIVVAVLGANSLITQFLHTNLFTLIYLIAVPYVVVKGAGFNARNSAYRNVRFGFGGFPPQTGWLSRHLAPGYNKTSQFLILPIVLVPITLGLLYPYYVWRKRQFLLEHTRYGTAPFSFDGRAGAFYLAYFKSLLMFLLFFVASAAAVGAGVVAVKHGNAGAGSAAMVAGLAILGVVILAFYILFAAYRDAVVARLSWRHTLLGELRFECRWKAWDLFKLYLSNSLAQILTLGLITPWAAIRTARYQLQGLSLQPAEALQGFVAGQGEQVGATGDEAADLLGFDLGF